MTDINKFGSLICDSVGAFVLVSR